MCNLCKILLTKVCVYINEKVKRNYTVKLINSYIFIKEQKFLKYLCSKVISSLGHQFSCLRKHSFTGNR